MDEMCVERGVFKADPTQVKQTPHQVTILRDIVKSGRYASYWNAELFRYLFTQYEQTLDTFWQHSYVDGCFCVAIDPGGGRLAKLNVPSEALRIPRGGWEGSWNLSVRLEYMIQVSRRLAKTLLRVWVSIEYSVSRERGGRVTETWVCAG